MSTKIGINIRKIRKAKGWTILELANRIGSDVGNISRLERGKQGFSQELLDKIAKAFNIPVSELFIPVDQNIVNAPITNITRIPLISYVQAGNMTEIIDQYEPGTAAEYLMTDLELSPNAFALEIVGDSMLPDFKPGDRIICDPNIRPHPGDFVVAKNGNNEATFKKYRPRGITESGEEVFELVPLNEDYPSIRSEVNEVYIIATMVEHRRYRKN